MKGYLCRVVRIFRNDVTVKLDSLLKIVTGWLLEYPCSCSLTVIDYFCVMFAVQAEFLSVPAKRG